MNKNEYIIINKTAIQKRIKELEKEYYNVKGNDDADEHFLDGRRTSFKEVLSQSTPLIPEIEKAWLDGNISSTRDYKEDYISNLKLSI